MAIGSLETILSSHWSPISGRVGWRATFADQLRADPTGPCSQTHPTPNPPLSKPSGNNLMAIGSLETVFNSH